EMSDVNERGVRYFGDRIRPVMTVSASSQGTDRARMRCRAASHLAGFDAGSGNPAKLRARRYVEHRAGATIVSDVFQNIARPPCKVADRMIQSRRNIPR